MQVKGRPDADGIWYDEHGDPAWDSRHPCVYFLLDKRAKALKIGTSYLLSRRMRELQTGNPNELYLLGWIRGGYEAEQWLHSTCIALHIRGEWFRADRRLLKTVRESIRIDRADRGLVA